MSLEDALAEMQELESRGDLGGIVKLRARIARDFPGTQAAAEALFRLGLYFLFVENQIPAAMQTLEDAVKSKDPHWSKAARVSLASLYLRENKAQKALLELRKALGEKDPPSIHSISALSIMEAIHEDAGATQLVRDVKEQKRTHLETLVAKSQADDAALSFYLISLAQEHAALGDMQKAKERATELVKMGPRASAQLLQQAQALLKLLG